MSLLTVEHLTIRFGGLVAIDDVSFAAEDRRITAIIGPNGAGKTTVFNCLTGFYKPDVGRMRVAAGGSEWLLERMEGFRIARDAGIARTFQNIRLFPKMTVLENLLVAQHKALQRASLFSLAGLLGAKSFRLAERAAIARARGWLERCNLVHVADDEAGSLPYGAQRRLEIERAHLQQAAVGRDSGGRAHITGHHDLIGAQAQRIGEHGAEIEDADGGVFQIPQDHEGPRIGAAHHNFGYDVVENRRLADVLFNNYQATACFGHYQIALVVPTAVVCAGGELINDNGTVANFVFG